MGALMGVDIGQKRDPTAICVAESERRQETGSTVNRHHFVVRHLERLPLGTPYPAVATRLGEIASRVQARVGGAEVFVDATGVGTPVVDLLREKLVRAGAIWAVYFTHGDRRVEEREKKEIKLGKAHLVSRLQALLQSDRLHLPDSSEARALAEELLNYEIRVDENANDRYGAFRVGTHDDLVTALGLAVQRDPWGPRFIGGGPWR